MKKIGLMGGLGPASTVEYYMRLNELCREKYGEEVYPEIIIDSVNMGIHTKYFNQKDYRMIGHFIYESLQNLKSGGAELAAVTANTEHIAWDYVKERLPIPTISIVDAVVEEMKKNGYQRIVTFATVWTLESGLYAKAVEEAGMTAIVPTREDQVLLGNLIYPNLENGIVIPEDKGKMIALAEKYIREQGADALLLGCTEIPLMIKEGDVSVPVINTTEVHIRRIFELADDDGV